MADETEEITEEAPELSQEELQALVQEMVHNQRLVIKPCRVCGRSRTVRNDDRICTACKRLQGKKLMRALTGKRVY